MRKNWMLLEMLACVAPANAAEPTGRTAAPTARADAQASARGMEFGMYIRLRKGMTGGELLERAGGPNIKRSTVPSAAKRGLFAAASAIRYRSIPPS